MAPLRLFDMGKSHILLPTPQTVHWGHLDAAISAVLEIESGDTVEIDTVSGGFNDVADPSHMRSAHRLIAQQVPQIMGPHILTGPIAVKGAMPGDTLEVRILEEGVAVRASDIDVVWIYGYGWPVYRGGPMFYADTQGLPQVVAAMERADRSVVPDQRQCITAAVHATQAGDELGQATELIGDDIHQHCR